MTLGLKVGDMWRLVERLLNWLGRIAGGTAKRDDFRELTSRLERLNDIAIQRYSDVLKRCDALEDAYRIVQEKLYHCLEAHEQQRLVNMGLEQRLARHEEKCP